MLSRDKRLPLDTWNTTGSQENVSGNQLSTFDSSPNHRQGIHCCTTPIETGSVPQAIGTGTCFARDEERIKGTIPMPTIAKKPSTMSSFILPHIPQYSVVGQQRQQTSELQFDRFPSPQSFLMLEEKIQKPGDFLFWFCIVGHVMDQRCGDSRFTGWIKILATNCWTEFSKFWNVRREDSKILTSRRRSVSKNRKPKKRTGFYEEDRSPSWSTTTFEWLALMIQYWIMMIYSMLVFMMTTFRNSIQDGTKFCCRCQIFHPMTSRKACTNKGYVSLINWTPYCNCTTWKFIKRYRCPIVRN